MSGEVELASVGSDGDRGRVAGRDDEQVASTGLKVCEVRPSPDGRLTAVRDVSGVRLHRVSDGHELILRTFRTGDRFVHVAFDERGRFFASEDDLPLLRIRAEGSILAAPLSPAVDHPSLTPDLLHGWLGSGAGP
jgi:hypothetical protein